MTSTRKLSDEERKQRNREKAKRYRDRHPDRTKASATKWKSKNPDFFKQHYEDNRDRYSELNREGHLRRKYGLTSEQYDVLLNSQGCRCAICGSLDPGSKTGWHIDHCHKTEQVRGILCHHCNLMLGNARDNPTTLMVAADYLRKFNGQTESTQ